MRKFLWLLFFLTTIDCYSQENVGDSVAIDKARKNIVKINLYSLFLKNYSISYERLISKKISLQIGYRFGTYDYWIDNLIGKEIVKQGIIDPRYYGFQIGNSAVTADVRFYLGRKKGMQGLFTGVCGRYAIFDADNVDFNYIPDFENVYNVPLVSNFSGIGGGIVIGKQWIIKKRITIENVSGIYYGKISGSLTSNKDLSGISETDKLDLTDNINSIFTIFNKNYLTDLTITDKGLNGKISGPFVGIRTSLTIGFIF